MLEVYVLTTPDVAHVSKQARFAASCRVHCSQARFRLSHSQELGIDGDDLSIEGYIMVEDDTHIVEQRNDGRLRSTNLLGVARNFTTVRPAASSFDKVTAAIEDEPDGLRV